MKAKQDGVALSIPFDMSKQQKRKLEDDKDFQEYTIKCFEHGEGYRDVCMRCRSMMFGIHLPALMTNVAFACELYLKSLLFFERKDCRNHHDLFKLYNMLSDDMKSSVRILRTRKSDKRGFELSLKENGEAFVVFRYMYENVTMSSDPQFLSELMDRCRELCLDVIPERLD